MTMIALYRGPYAPTGFIICTAVPDGKGKFDWDEKGEVAAKAAFTAEERRELRKQDPDVFSNMFTRLIQVDWDFPGTASSFGWSPTNATRGSSLCRHDGTDGTIDCPSCGFKAGDFIASAREYLDECADNAKVVEDPGYFGESV